MVNDQLIEELLIQLREDECGITWLKHRIRMTAEGLKQEKLFKDLQFSIAARNSTRKMLDQYYIWGISPEQIHQDIQR